MTDIDGTPLPAALASWPTWTLTDAQLGDLELITSGVFAPLTGFMGQADLAAVTESGTLADGTPWPVPVTLDLPPAAVPAGADYLVLQDQEGSPLAFITITEATAAGEAIRLAGPVTVLRQPEHGPFRGLRRTPADVRAELEAASPGRAVLAYATRRPLHRRHIGQLKHYADLLNARLLVLPLVSGPALVVTRPEALVRAILAAAARLPAGTRVVPGPLARAGPARTRCGPARQRRGGGRLRCHLPAGGPGRGDRSAGRGRLCRHRLQSSAGLESYPCPACRFR